MKGTQVRRVFALFMIVMVLSWTTLPAIAMATWLKAGSPITGTKPITHGGPLKAGAFIAPGEVITGGSAIEWCYSEYFRPGHYPDSRKK